MHVKSTLISAAIIISSAVLLGSAPVQAQDRPTKEGDRLRQLCDGGDRRACVHFGMLLNENRGRHDEWRRSHPEFWSFQGTSDKSARGSGGDRSGPTYPGVEFLIPARASACTKASRNAKRICGR